MNSTEAAVFRIESSPIAPEPYWSDVKKADWARKRRFYTCKPLPGENDAAHYTGDNEKTLKPENALLREQSARRLGVKGIPDKSEARNIAEYTSRFNSLGVFGLHGALTEDEFSEWIEGAKKAGGTVWTCVISFPAEQSLKVGYEDCEKLIRQTFEGFLRNAKFNPKNIAVMAAAHENTENTHIHVTFYEKAPKYRNKSGKLEYRQKYKLPAYVLSEYRASITAYMDENKRDLSKYRDVVMRQLNGWFTDKDLAVELKALNSKLPEKGRLQYNAKQIEPFRQAIDNIAIMLIRRDSVAKSAHLKMLEEIARRAKELGGTNAYNTYAKRLTNEYKSRLGNVILSMVKQMRFTPKSTVNAGRGKSQNVGVKANAARARKQLKRAISMAAKAFCSGAIQADFTRELERAERQVQQSKQNDQERIGNSG